MTTIYVQNSKKFRGVFECTLPKQKAVVVEYVPQYHLGRFNTSSYFAMRDANNGDILHSENIDLGKYASKSQVCEWLKKLGYNVHDVSKKPSVKLLREAIKELLGESSSEYSIISDKKVSVLMKDNYFWIMDTNGKHFNIFYNDATVADFTVW